MQLSNRAWYATVAAFLLLVSVALFIFHYAVFRDPHHIWIFLVHDVAFLPVEVMLVGLVLERLLSRRERQSKEYKLNMVYGAFFSELGEWLLRELSDGVAERNVLDRYLDLDADWSEEDFERARAYAQELDCDMDIDRMDLDDLREGLQDRRPALTRYLENPSVLETDEFTDLIWAILHLTEELEARTQLESLPDNDAEHLAGDVRRIYGKLTAFWVSYARHLQEDYPYLYSLVVRTHPFQENPSAVVT